MTRQLLAMHERCAYLGEGPTGVCVLDVGESSDDAAATTGGDGKDQELVLVLQMTTSLSTQSYGRQDAEPED